MPGNIQNATPSVTLPATFSSAFRRVDEYILIRNDYNSGDSQRGLHDISGRARWQLSKRLSPSDMSALREFYFARSGPHDCFYFIDENDVSWIVRFNSDWEQTLGMARGEVSIELIEVV